MLALNMPFIIKNKIWNIKDSLITDEKLFFDRRKILKNMAKGSLIYGGLIPFSQSTIANNLNYYPPKINYDYKVKRPLTKESYATTYTNFYEFGSSKNIWRRASKLKTEPWTLSIDGLVKKPLTLDLNTLLKKMRGIEERVYRFRCVEAWSMTVPWSGFQLNKILSLVEPKSNAKFLKFETFFDPNVAPGQKQKWYPWPYNEGITIDEAMNKLTFIATGIYGKPLPNQNGAPLRLVLPWKYGFKSIKSIVKITFVSEQPKGMWEQLAPSEYGFWANVNPEVSHPRWSQAFEKPLGYNEKIPSEIYNGYGKQVANLYDDLKDSLKDKLFR